MLQPNVTVTPAAEKFIRRMVRFSEHPERRLSPHRVGRRLLGLQQRVHGRAGAEAGDSELLVNGVKVYLPAESRLMLDGVTIDFADTPTKSGLTFINPNAAACGCSSSGDAAAPPAQATVSVSSITRMTALPAGH